jgi:hypothetical protein
MKHPAEAFKPAPTQALITIGIDVSKDHLDAARHPSGDSLRVPNPARAVRSCCGGSANQGASQGSCSNQLALITACWRNVSRPSDCRSSK